MPSENNKKNKKSFHLGGTKGGCHLQFGVVLQEGGDELFVLGKNGVHKCREPIFILLQNLCVVQSLRLNNGELTN